MSYIYAFLFVGTLCLVAQIIIDNTNLSFGHITSMYVVVGAILGFLNLYDKIKSIIGPAASLPITSFGNLLYKAAEAGYIKNGILGVFQNMLAPVSSGIVSAVVFAFIFGLLFKPKD